MQKLSMLLALFISCLSFGWEWDFSKERIPMSWWSANGREKLCSIEYATNPLTGKQSLKMHWDSKGSGWMHVYKANVPGLESFKIGTYTFKITTTGPLNIHECNLRIQDRDKETFYFVQPVNWNKAGQWTVQFVVDPSKLDHEYTSKHGKVANEVLDFPLHGLGINFCMFPDSGSGDLYVDYIGFEANKGTKVVRPPATWEQVSSSLDANPSRGGDWGRRWLTHRDYDTLLRVAKSEDDPKVGEYYNSRVLKIIEEVKAWRSDVPKAWKLYSSGLVVKDGEKVFGIDVNIGCDMPGRKVALRMRPEVLDALADVLDAVYYTHEHRDHCSQEVVDVLLAKKKKIYAGAAAIKVFKMGDGAIVAEKHTEPGYHVFESCQRMGKVNVNFVQCLAYVWELSNGATLFVRGDIYHPDDIGKVLSWVDNELKIKIDYAAVNASPSLVQECSRRWGCSFIPLHEWEFTHRKFGLPGPATQPMSTLYRVFGKQAQAGLADILSWGESVELKMLKR